MLKNSSTLAVSVPINPPIQSDFVSLNGPRETYFMDVVHIIMHFCAEVGEMGRGSCAPPLNSEP